MKPIKPNLKKIIEKYIKEMENPVFYDIKISLPNKDASNGLFAIDKNRNIVGLILDKTTYFDSKGKMHYGTKKVKGEIDLDMEKSLTHISFGDYPELNYSVSKKELELCGNYEGSLIVLDLSTYDKKKYNITLKLSKK